MGRRLLFLLICASLLASLLAPAGVRAETPKVPLVLIHGLAGSPESTWGIATQWFSTRGYVAGETLFKVNLRATENEAPVLGVLADANVAATEIRRILKETGASRVDVIGNSRGGLVVRLLASGETAGLIRRAVTIDAPHAGVLPDERMAAILDYAKINQSLKDSLPADMKAQGAALKTLEARETRFADRRAPALAIASTYVDGHDEVLQGSDGFVGVESQLAWPGARKATVKIGPTKEKVLEWLASNSSFMVLAQGIPHVIAVESEGVLTVAYEYLTEADVAAPARDCEPGCMDWALLTGHWSAATVQGMLPDKLPYSLDAKGQRVFEPNRPMTRSEFVYGLTRGLGLAEQLRPTAFADLHGHWALGYVEAAVAANLVKGLSADTFGSDVPLNRAQAATLVVRMKGWAAVPGPSRFADARGHWAEGNIEAAAANGIIKGDERGFRPDDSLTMAEAAMILNRSFTQ